MCNVVKSSLEWISASLSFKRILYYIEVSKATRLKEEKKIIRYVKQESFNLHQHIKQAIALNNIEEEIIR